MMNAPPSYAIQPVAFTQLQEEALVELAMRARRRAEPGPANGSRRPAGRSRHSGGPLSAGPSEPGDRSGGPPRAERPKRGAARNAAAGWRPDLQ